MSTASIGDHRTLPWRDKIARGLKIAPGELLKGIR
jgi:hypothetical protein